jgi:hypothetical protein
MQQQEGMLQWNSRIKKEDASKKSFGIVFLSKDVLLIERENCGPAYNFSRFSIY